MTFPILSPISPIFVGGSPHPCDVVMAQGLTLPNGLALLRARLSDELLCEDLLCGRWWEIPSTSLGGFVGRSCRRKMVAWKPVVRTRYTVDHSPLYSTY
ncbi:hypothetical protein CH063_07471 [Colletotrichum higginsianum]|uniref:Uncharacterized protein n=1 Tax=Colletotrichum higginsianum (strain IMI 349063) TaxID=759273 RepID=H1V6A9_COLHI|nr:hypothetical protein CH063_07471 [Colletotrichum higginsianum]